jgi:hypothetical protein
MGGLIDYVAAKADRFDIGDSANPTHSLVCYIQASLSIFREETGRSGA